MKYNCHIFSLYLCLVIGLLACSKDASSSDNASIAAAQNQVNLDVEAPAKPPAEWTFLTKDLFHYTYVDKIGEDIPKSDYIGKWIDLHDDWTYDGGFLSDRTTAGTWDYDHTSKILNLIPIDGSKRSEWKVLHNNDRIVMAGTSKFGDNAFQIRWNRYAEKPVKIME